MKNSIVSISLAAVIAAAPAVAQQNDILALTPQQQATVDLLIERALNDDLAYEITESLTTEIGPRLGGSEAEARARDWGAAKLREHGFQNVRIETYEMPYWERIAESAAIVSPFPQPLAITALGGSVSTPADGVEAEIVRFASMPALAAAPMTGFEGKIIFVDETMGKTQDGSSYGTAVQMRNSAAIEAGKRGAVAAIIRSVGTDSHRNPHTGGMRYDDNVRKIPMGAVSNPDADQLARALERADGPVRVTMNIQTRTEPAVESGNVIGEIVGRSDDLIVIGGHIDSWDLGTGAIDDAAGIGITMAAAKLVDDLKGKPTRTIRVVMWGAEEVGLLGARAYAAKHADDLERHSIAAESDFGAGRVWQLQTNFGEEHLPKARAMQNALRPLNVIPGDNNATSGPDIIPLRLRGVPTLALRQDGTDYFDLHHTPDDTFDKINIDDLRQNVAAWAVTIYLASELPGDFRAAPAEVASE